MYNYSALIFIFLFYISFLVYRKKSAKGTSKARPYKIQVFWLDFLLFCWFILPIQFAIKGLNRDFYFILYIVATLMGIKYIVQAIYIKYLKKNSYKVSLVINIISIIIFTISLMATQIYQLAEKIFILALMISLYSETGFRILFNKIKQNRPEALNRSWFAPVEDQDFKVFIRLHWIAVFICYPLVIYYFYYKIIRP